MITKIKPPRSHTPSASDQIYALIIQQAPKNSAFDKIEPWIKRLRLKTEDLCLGATVQAQGSFALKSVKAEVFASPEELSPSLTISSKYCRKACKWGFVHAFDSFGFSGQLCHFGDSWTGRLSVEAGCCPEQSQQRLKEALAVLNLKVERFDLIRSQLTLGLINNRKENDHAGR